MFYEFQYNWFQISATGSFISPDHTKKQEFNYFPLHIHPYIEISHVISGDVTMQIGTGLYHLQPGDLAISFPNIPHDYHVFSKKEDTCINIINCDPELLPMHREILLGKYPINPCIHADQLHEDISYAEKRLMQMDPREDNIPLKSTLCSLILCRIFSNLNFVDVQNTTHDMTSKILFYVSTHFQEELSLDHLSSVFGIGKYTISRIFSNILKISFSQYINTLRIDHAQILLVTTDKNILTIAVESGYNNQQTFNRIFREMKGCTPKEFRRQFFHK
ncbi:MAG: AraC family transcriptional regulator [Clostridia bacterium]|nr:AraC family transcriptional regulator [Clostridia bacterium]NCC44064.1 AraC family transcriptional regulator [Clostridia bacterium]